MKACSRLNLSGVGKPDCQEGCMRRTGPEELKPSPSSLHILLAPLGWPTHTWAPDLASAPAAFLEAE